MAIAKRYTEAHKDAFGFLASALSGVTQWTPAQFRNTGVVLNNIAKGDVFSYNLQFNHDKKLQSALDGFHAHLVPLTANSGNIAIDYAWGIYHEGDVIPDTLPNTGTTLIAIANQQYVHLIKNIVGSMTIPSTEKYSSFFLIKCTRRNDAQDTFTGDFALLGADVHYITDRLGSMNEVTD
mgnify:FL=1